MAEGSSINPRRVAIAQLAAYFPLGASKERSEMYLNHQAISKVETRDLAEAVERLCVTRNEKSFPTFAIVLRVCREAANDRRVAERAHMRHPEDLPPGPLTDLQLDSCHKMRELARRGVTYCDVCCGFRQKTKGQPSCHYEQCRRMWREGTDKPVRREQIMRAFERFVPEVEVIRPEPAKVADFTPVGEALGEVVF